MRSALLIAFLSLAFVCGFVCGVAWAMATWIFNT